MFTGVYAIYRKGTRLKYIGSTATGFKGRKQSHMKLLRAGCHHSRYLQFAWNKYGPEAFGWQILHRCDASEVLRWEQFYIDKYQSAKGRGYNMCPVAGNTAGKKMSPENIEKNRNRMLAFRHSAESKKKISEAHKGRKFSEEHCRNLSIARQNNPKLIAMLVARNKSVRQRAFVMAKNKSNKEAMDKTAAWHRGRKRTGQALENIRRGIALRHKSDAASHIKAAQKRLGTMLLRYGTTDPNKTKNKSKPDRVLYELSSEEGLSVCGC